ncbi:MAG: ABC transporter permease [Streptococcaceae bacterium]|jgi:ABC-2 type transport system permease protein|nr:ABC transporter permease [Streptococcaceae bacterium]
MNAIFKKRRDDYYTQTFKYLRYVFNDHFLLFLVIALAALAVQYAQFVQQHTLSPLEKGFVILVVTGVSLAFGRLATFVEAADGVFLLAKEVEIRAELRKAVRRSLLLPSTVGLVLIVISQLALKLPLWGLVLWFLLILALKYFLLARKLHRFSPTENTLDWQNLIDYEKERQTSLLKIYSLFTNVKGLSNRAKRRRYLDFLAGHSPKNAMRLLYCRTFLRAGDYLSLTLRLGILSFLCVAFIPNIWAAMLAAFILNYALIFQLVAMENSYADVLLARTYPQRMDLARQELLRLLLFIAFGLFILQFIIVVVTHIGAGMLLAAALVIPLFEGLYLTYRLRTKKA